MGLPNKLYFLLTVAWWILLMGFGSCTSGLSISLFHFSALLIFHLGSCPQPRILSQPWSPWWALPTSPGLSVTSWGDPAWVGSWQHTQGQIYAFTSLFDRNVRADAVLLRDLSRGSSVTHWEGAGHCHPQGQLCSPCTHQGVLRSGHSLPCSVTLTGDAQKRKKQNFILRRRDLTSNELNPFGKGDFQWISASAAADYSHLLITAWIYMFGTCTMACCSENCWVGVVLGSSGSLSLHLCPSQTRSGTWPLHVGLVAVRPFSTAVNNLSAVDTSGNVCLLVTLSASHFPVF